MTHTRAQAIDVLSLADAMGHSSQSNPSDVKHNENTNYLSNGNKTSVVSGNDSNVLKSSKSLFGSNFNNFQRINTFLKNELAEIRHAVEDNIDYHNERSTPDRESLSPILPSGVDTQSVVIERQGGLANRFVIFLLLLWYLFSAFTLYTNKYIVLWEGNKH